MEPRISALLVHVGEGCTARLRYILKRHFDLSEARSYRDASPFLVRPHPPHLVVTSPKLPDGTWREVLSLARAASEAVSVVVASGVANTRLYIETMEAGAADFITSSLATEDLSYVLKNAADAAILRRNRQARVNWSGPRDYPSPTPTGTPLR